MPQTKPEIISSKIQAEIKRLAPNAVVRTEFSGDDTADVYIYAPRRFCDMLASRAKKLRDAEVRGDKFLTIRILAEDVENMSDEAKAKYGIQG